MPLAGLKNSDLKLILFGGKGGVGKTCCALATALSLSKDFKTLIISTDPAHSISDCLGQFIGNKITQVKGEENLAAIEINANEVFAHFKEDNEEELKKLLDTSTNLDDEDINQLLSLPIPGIDEIMSFKTILDFMEEGRFEKYVMDTAPTGHALRLLSSPKLLNAWIAVMAKMRWKYRYMVTTFSGSYTSDETDDLLLRLKKTVNGIEKMLRDSSKCEFIPVCIPEVLSVSETNTLIRELDHQGIVVKQLIVNSMHNSEGCVFCQQRKAAQLKYLDKIREKHQNLQISVIPLMVEEVKGLVQLNKLEKELSSSEEFKNNMSI